MVMHKIHKASQLDGPGRQAAQSDKVIIDTAGNVYLDSRSQGEIFYYFLTTLLGEDCGNKAASPTITNGLHWVNLIITRVCIM